MRLSGDPIRSKLNESTLPSISGHVGQVSYGHCDTRQATTETFKTNIEIATADVDAFRVDIKSYFQNLEKYEGDLEGAEAPYTKGRKL